MHIAIDNSLIEVTLLRIQLSQQAVVALAIDRLLTDKLCTVKMR